MTKKLPKLPDLKEAFTKYEDALLESASLKLLELDARMATLEMKIEHIAQTLAKMIYVVPERKETD
jgi:hypothetical protein